jgi:hypothetical protein
MAGMGHEERLPPSRLNGCCRFGQGTFARTRDNDEEAPEAAIFEPQNLRQSAVAFYVGG